MDRSPDAVTTGADGRRGKPRRAVGVVLIALLGLAGAGLLVASFFAPVPRPPQPTAAVAPKVLTPAVKGNQPGAPDGAPSVSGDVARPVPGMARSVPVGITIPAIGVKAKMMSLGLDKNGSIAVPPRDKAMLAGWYDLGPTPGEVGNAVIVGHVDSAVIGPAVFFKLGALKPGAAIHVSRKDGTVADFTVDGVKAYPKAQFPTDLVYGPSDQVSLRLVTCGGPWNKTTSYRDNVIVFATLKAPKKAAKDAGAEPTATPTPAAEPTTTPTPGPDPATGPPDLEPGVPDPADLEPGVPDPADLEPAVPDPADLEPGVPDPADLDSQGLDPADLEPGVPDPADLEQMGRAPADRDPAAVPWGPTAPPTGD